MQPHLGDSCYPSGLLFYIWYYFLFGCFCTSNEQVAGMAGIEMVTPNPAPNYNTLLFRLPFGVPSSTVSCEFNSMYAALTPVFLPLTHTRADSYVDNGMLIATTSYTYPYVRQQRQSNLPYPSPTFALFSTNTPTRTSQDSTTKANPNPNANIDGSKNISNPNRNPNTTC